ncbi:hypothetical protein TCAL_00663 [Tigriopus californicus]|uniref:Guanine nucleotide-binding protein-like 3 homolog n=1 Tax=Tigriopus californicus TaxID=6832 RepID=A0A553PBR7_TIGCA|nr:guanine nucleotide-binding protein-like 3 homolog [Tigriopus californicus]TRY75131.1 hypothetical protein TCAL_00663 [Tigriopus californicus]|eukprot:TCALIF_00663-PA protein Name:"Similar to nst-1 Guanine nucleotide-binding protein-like 3 homolog (Caenorhabditis elegans)" AED:0.00 eAED:0.00 QI:0/-1/0/1/-1/1/1/0/570
MVSQFIKKRSKRIPTAIRAKAEKKVREHNRKLKKEKRLRPGGFKNKAKKDPGIPNDCPFKEAILQDVAEARRRKQEEKDQRRQILRQRRVDGQGGSLGADNLTDLVQQAQLKAGQHQDREAGHGSEEEEEEEEGAADGLGERSAKAFYKEFAKVVDAADVILQVLDARDPLGTRNASAEQKIRDQGSRKRLVLVLNKADLVPKDNLEAWIRYLRREYPTIAFKSSTQNQGHNLGQSKLKIKPSTIDQLQTSKSVGSDTLMALLANYCRNKDVKTAIRVGVIGYPNVGKSSLINSLKRSRACHVGNTPGVTKVVQEIQIDSKVKLLDSPGMILAAKGQDSAVQNALRNAIKVEELADPVTPVTAILQRCEKRYMQLTYNVGDYQDAHTFLNLVALSLGKLKKGGVPDHVMAARMVLQDWHNGKIKYFTHPPELPTDVHLGAEVVDGFAAEFSLDQLETVEQADMEALPEVLASEAMHVDLATPLQTSADEEASHGPLARVAVIKSPSLAQTKKAKILAKLPQKKVPKSVEEPQNLKKLQKLREKKAKKDRKRRDRVSMELSQGLDSALSTF